MSTFSDCLESMSNRVEIFRPRVNSVLIHGWLNDRIRQVIDAKLCWADLLERRIVSVPNEYATGTVSLSPGLALVTGAATAWPVNDVVNRTIPLGVSEIGYVEVTPAVDMTGITADSVLYVDATGTPETVPVVEVTPYTFIGKFNYLHNVNCTVTQSSLMGRQFRLSVESPIFTVRSVHSATSLELDMPWGAASVTASAYRIVKMYFSLGSDFKDIIGGIDPTAGTTMRLHVSVQEMNYRDPQRTTTGFGRCLEVVDLGPNESGSMLFEIWPEQSTARQLWFLVAKQWPEMKRANDRPPWFINPTVFVHGAIADALRYKQNEKDPFHNPTLAREYEMRFLQGVEDAKNADEAKAMRSYTFGYDQMFMGPGSSYWQQHDPDVRAGLW